MKAIVMYKSKTGYAKKYAIWIAEALSADIFEASKISADKLTEYDTVIYGGGLYASGINGVKTITQNIDKLKDKKIVVFASGLSSPKEEAINQVINKNFTQEQQKYIKFYYLRGGFNYSKLGSLDKLLMSMLKLIINNKRKKGKELEAEDMEMLSAFEKPIDFTSKDNIDGIITYVNS